MHCVWFHLQFGYLENENENRQKKTEKILKKCVLDSCISFGGVEHEKNNNSKKKTILFCLQLYTLRFIVSFVWKKYFEWKIFKWMHGWFTEAKTEQQKRKTSNNNMKYTDISIIATFFYIVSVSTIVLLSSKHLRVFFYGFCSAFVCWQNF